MKKKRYLKAREGISMMLNKYASTNKNRLIKEAYNKEKVIQYEDLSLETKEHIMLKIKIYQNEVNTTK